MLRIGASLRFACRGDRVQRAYARRWLRSRWKSKARQTFDDHMR